MTPVLAQAAASIPAHVPAAAPAPVTPQASNAYDVDRLRALVAGQPTGQAAPQPPVTATGEAEGTTRTLGDSILAGVAKFNGDYSSSLKGITDKLERVSDPVALGNNFGEIMALQIEVAKWTMSVMGVDNASKAGTNTIKELSKGG